MRRSVQSVTTSILAALGAVLALAACGSSEPDTGIDPATTSVTVGRPLLLPGDTVTVTLQTRDATGQPLVIEGATVVFSAQGGSSVGAFLPVVDHQDGTYSAKFVGATPGTALTITAQVDGEPIASALPTLRVVGFTRIAVAGTIILSPDSGSGGFTCGIITTGDMYCWGLYRFGIRGNGQSTTPREREAFHQASNPRSSLVDISGPMSPRRTATSAPWPLPASSIVRAGVRRSTRQWPLGRCGLLYAVPDPGPGIREWHLPDRCYFIVERYMCDHPREYRDVLGRRHLGQAREWERYTLGRPRGRERWIDVRRPEHGASWDVRRGHRGGRLLLGRYRFSRHW